MWCGADGSTKCGGITAADVYALEEENDDDSGGGGAFFSEGGSGDGTYGPLMEVGDDSDDNNNDSLLLEQLLELHNAARSVHFFIEFSFLGGGVKENVFGTKSDFRILKTRLFS